MVKNFAKGEIIVHEGDISTCAFLIDGGGVEVLKTLPNGKYRRVAVLKATEIFGEMGLIDDLPRSATVRALDEGCTVSILTKENYQVLLMFHKLLLLVVTYNIFSSEWILNFSI